MSRPPRKSIGPALGQISASIFALVMTLSTSPTAAAAEYQSPVVGGPGGRAFSLRCAPGDYLVGLAGRHGAWVDAVAPLCANWDAKARTFLPPGVGPMQGGGGGAPAQIACGPRALVVSLLVDGARNDDKTVAFVSITCADPLTGKKERTATALTMLGASPYDVPDSGGVGTQTTVDYDWRRMPHCAEGDVAVGIFGASGKYLDRIGLICAPAPRAIAAPVVPKPVTPIARPNVGAVARLPNSTSPVVDPATCLGGYVWREARAGDTVCVPPDSRRLARAENAAAASRVDPAGAYGPNTCVAGFVWREAFAGDLVCVTPERRDAVRAENAAAASRRVGP
ncbi:MAG: hypothetical protein KJS97_09545 [Alphaproteobacteria bacterium]|nr:hypothetical protein [Alphaproteobacteria bacterium]